MSYIFADVLMC